MSEADISWERWIDQRDINMDWIMMTVREAYLAGFDEGWKEGYGEGVYDKECK